MIIGKRKKMVKGHAEWKDKINGYRSDYIKFLS